MFFDYICGLMTGRKVKIAAIGLGNRTYKYLHYIAEHRDLADLVAVIDGDESKYVRAKEMFSIPDERCFSSVEDLLDSGIEVDACIIGTPDVSHYELTIQALESGWHVLLEKPMGQSVQQCRDIVRTSKKTGKLVTVCYVLRYHPYFIKMKELSESPSVGKILSIRHTERVGYDRTAHTFVRGPWNRKEMNTTVFFTKCCHDVDLVLWLSGQDVKSIASVKGNRVFSEDNAPVGAASRCIECQIEHSCPYSAVDLYLRRRDWIKGFMPLTGESQEDMIGRVLAESRYGRCVYCCPENDVIDRQKVILEMESGMRAEISMECLTDATNRVTLIDCENAVIYGDESSIEVRYKDGRGTDEYDFRWTESLGYHARADFHIIEEFIDAIYEGHLNTRTTSENSLESHLICLQVEEQRA